MSKKILATSIILLIFGGITIPGGLIVNNLIHNMVADRIDDGLLGIREQGIPLAIPLVEDGISAFYVYWSITYLTNQEGFFNDPLYQNPIGDIDWRSISNYTALGNLSYSTQAQNNILDGVYVSGWGTVRGIIDRDTEDNGTFIPLIDLYEDAKINNEVKLEVLKSYNSTWEQLTYLVNFYKEFLRPNQSYALVPTVGALQYPSLQNIYEIAEYELYDQWANAATEPKGFALPLKAGIRYGFEIGYQGSGLDVIPTNMSHESFYQLWNISNPYSLINDAGQGHWWNIGPKHEKNYNDTRDANYLNDIQVEMILEWLPKFRDNVMPYLAQEEYTLPMDTTTLGNVIQTGGIILGVSFIGIAAIGLTGNIILKRRRDITS